MHATRGFAPLSIVILTCTLSPAHADEPKSRDSAPSGRIAPRIDSPPRKVVVGTAVYGPYGPSPGLESRVRAAIEIIEEMARRAPQRDGKPRLDLAILPETILTASNTPAPQRAAPLRGLVQDTFSALARRLHCYILVPLDLLDESLVGPIVSNAAVLFDRSGNVQGVYRKQHPVAYVGSSELEGGVTPGHENPVFHCDFGKLGVQICWDIQFDEGWQTLADQGAEIVAWPTASPATVLPAMRAVRHRYYVVSSPWRDNATIYEPTGMVAARIEPPSRVLVHEIDLSFAVLGWSAGLANGEALRKKYGDRVGFHYDPREDVGLFWSNDPATPIGSMIRSIGGEELDAQVARNRTLYKP